MSDPSTDRELRALFARLKLADRARMAPSTSTLEAAQHRIAAGESARPRRGVVSPRGLLGAAAIAATVLVAVWLRFAGPAILEGDPASDPIEIAYAMSAWSAPTDPLLEVSELILLGGVPSLELTSVSVSDVSVSTPLE